MNNVEEKFEIALVLDGDLSSLSDMKKNAFIKAIGDFLEAEYEIKIKKVRKGSIKIYIDLTAEDIIKLSAGIKAGIFTKYSLLGLEIENKFLPMNLIDEANKVEYTDKKSHSASVSTSNNQIVDNLNELVKINNDRIQGYEKAIEDNEDTQLDDLFRHYIIQSQNFRSQLADQIVRIDGLAVSDVTSTDTTSKIHRAWIDIKSALTGKDRDSVLSSVEFGENAAIEAYKEALEKENIPAYIKEDLEIQLAELNSAYTKIMLLNKVS